MLKAGVPSVLAEAGGVDELDVECRGRIALCLTAARARRVGGRSGDTLGLTAARLRRAREGLKSRTKNAVSSNSARPGLTAASVGRETRRVPGRDGGRQERDRAGSGQARRLIRSYNAVWESGLESLASKAKTKSDVR